MRVILKSLILSLAFYSIIEAVENEEDKEEEVVLTVYEIDPDPFTNHTKEEKEDEAEKDTATTDTTVNTASTTANADSTTVNTGTTTEDTTRHTSPSTTHGSTTATTGGRPLCTTLQLATATSTTRSELPEKTEPTTESTVSFNTESTTNGGTTEQECVEAEDETEEIISDWKHVPLAIENDPIGKLPEDEWSICGSKFFNIWTRYAEFPSFGSWLSFSIQYESRHNLEHTDREDQKLWGYIWVSNVRRK